MVRALAGPAAAERAAARQDGSAAEVTRPAGQRPRCNILGPAALGFRHRDDLREITQLLTELGIEVSVVAPLGATAADLARLGDADFNVVLYPEIAALTAGWLQRNFGQPATKIIPIGASATREFIEEVAQLAGVDPSAALQNAASRSPWYARSVDSTYLTGKRVFVFGDATHAVAAARVASQEFGFKVVGIGTYSREFAREIRAAAKLYDVEPLISDDYLEIEARVAELQPELVLGTQMERHIAKRLGIPCAVISAPVHVQDFPARYSPQMGFEGANVLFDTWVHPLMMGLEEHLIGMFRGDFEFHEDAAPSHLGRAGTPQSARIEAQAQAQTEAVTAVATAAAQSAATVAAAPPDVNLPAAVAAIAAGAGPAPWAPEAEKELAKIPFFVRGKARRNTERYALERGASLITIETLYDAKAHFSR
jgi:light-independent protochlorophyllide reductase subunit B